MKIATACERKDAFITERFLLIVSLMFTTPQ